MQQAAEIKVGLFVIAVVALGVFIAGSLKSGVGGGKKGYEFEIWFETAPGVGAGSPVRLAGVDIGEVIAKDVVQVTESLSFGVPSQPSALPLERIRTWTVSRPGEADYAAVIVAREPISVEDSQRVTETSRPRNVARLKVQVKREYEMFAAYRYEIQGGLVFGDRQLNISDAGTDGLPMPAEARGLSIPTELEKGIRVAVLGISPPNVDKIVGNVERVVDQDSVARTKAIIAHIEKATEEASNLIGTLRETVQANQGNADRLMGNLAQASEDVQQLMGEARVLAGETLANVNQMSEVGRRVAGNNEAKLDRLMTNADAAVASFARVARSSEGKADRAMTDVAAIARDVRGLVASNRENLDRIVSRLADTADDVKAITGASREHVDSIMKNVDESVGQVRRLLDQTDEQLASIVTDTQGLVADARASVKSVRESVEPITGNLRETSEHVKTATKNVADLTGDPALKQTMSNLERTTAEARELIGDLRNITADPQVQADLKATTKSVRSVSERLDNTLSGVSSFRPTAFADVYYVPDASSWRSDVGVSVTGKKTSYHVGMDNVTNDPTLSFQLGRSLFTPDLRVRYGFYRSQLGIGADYWLWDRARVRADFYNPGDPQLNTRFTYRTPFGLTGLIGVEDVFDRFDWTLGFQLGKDLR